jgi:Flp pilus assembly protein TadB
MVEMGEFIGEVFLGFLSLAAGFVLGSVVFLLVRAGRWTLLRTERATAVTDPAGRQWTVRIPLAPSSMRFWVSTRLFSMRRDDRRRREAEGVSPDQIEPSEFAHPRQLVNTADDAAGLFAAVMLVFVVLALFVLLLEAIVVALVAIAVLVARLAWGRWQCEVVAPDGRRALVGAGSLSEARTRAVELSDSIKRDGSVAGLVV